MFALIRGKISEGLDFSHEKCRAVVVVGVPFPAARDVKVEAKRKYLDVKASKHPKECLTGSQWYMTETIRSLNQAMGRIVRNKSDYGAVYLIDSRFGQTDIMNQISSWVR